MLLIKRNTKEFKAIRNLVSEYEGHASVKKYILLYSVKSYQDLDEKILLNTLKKDSSVLYALAYDSLREYLHAKNKKLFRNERQTLYCFKTSGASKSIELPFAFAGKLKKELSPLLEKPVSKPSGKVIPIGRGIKKKKGV